jgi:23S rRNA G2445 N2-methylase RlmL
MRLKDAHDLAKVAQGARQAVNLVDNDDVDLAARDSLKQTLKARALNVGAAVAAVVKGRRVRPARVGLAANKVQARVSLRVEAIKILLKPSGRGLARVDRAAHHLRAAQRVWGRRL